MANSRLPNAKQAAPEMAFRRDVLADHASGVHRYDRASVVRGDAMTDDITHNLTVVREALEAEGLSVHVGRSTQRHPGARGGMQQMAEGMTDTLDHDTREMR